MCMVPPPMWSGPAVMRTDGCQGPVPVAVDAVFGELSFDPATCNCTCGPSEGLSCVATVGAYNISDDCTAAYVGSTELPDGDCSMVETMNSQPIFSLEIESTTAEGVGTCTPSYDTLDPEEPTWGVSYELCGEPFVACGDGVCMPDFDTVPGEGICIWRSGAYDCPSEYPNKTVAFRSFEDTRSCSDECSCAPPANPECVGEVSVYDGGCNGDEIGAQSVGNPPTCINNANVQTANAFYDAQLTNDACQPEGGESLGTVSEVDRVTVCCG